jgi:uncharacterized protein (DUF983 family)
VRGLIRAVLARCPLCGARGIWRSFGQMVDHCPGCGYRFAREEGYWVGGLVVNIGVAIALFFVVFVGGMVVTWPEVPWTGLGIVSVLAMGVGPVGLYPQSKTIWVWIDRKFHPYGGEEP